MKPAIVRILVLSLALSFGCAAPARAQDTLSASSAPSGGGFCFRGRPRPKCGSFMLTEFSMRRPLGAVPDVDPTTELELGIMVNVGRASAIGGTAQIGGEESVRRTGVGLRYRRWLTSRLGAELGVSRFSECEQTGRDSCARSRPGFTTQGGLVLSDLVGVTVVYQHVNAGASRPGEVVTWSYPARSQWSAGVKFGSYAAPLVALGLGALVAATW